MKSYIVNVFLLLGCMPLSVDAADASSVSSSVKAPVSSGRRAGSLCSRLGAVLCVACLAVLPVNGSVGQGEVAQSDFGELSIDDPRIYLDPRDLALILECFYRVKGGDSEAEARSFIASFEEPSSPLKGFNRDMFRGFSTEELHEMVRRRLQDSEKGSS